MVPICRNFGTETLVTSATHLSENEDSSWWRRPAGGREVLGVALPLVVSTVSWTVMTFVDRMFLNWSSSVEMAAAFSASMVWFALLCLPLGICSYANTFVSQYFGDGQPEQIGPSVWQGVWAALGSIPLCLLALPLAATIFALAEHGAEAEHLVTKYFHILCLGGPVMLIAAALSSCYGGRGPTWVVMIVDTAIVVVNLGLDYLWIFSADDMQSLMSSAESTWMCWFPYVHNALLYMFGDSAFLDLGIAGAGWATVVSLWLKALVYLLLILREKNRREFQTWTGLRFDRKLFGRLIYFGFPSGVQMLLDVLGWTIFVLLVGRLGPVENTATTLAFSISSVAFMPIWGFGMATAILVGQKLGEDRDDLAARATTTLLAISLAYMAIVSVLYVLTPDLFLSGFYAANTEATEQEAAIYAMAVNLLCFVAGYNLFDAVLMMFANALKGAGDTRYILRISVVMAGLLAGCSWFVVEVLEAGIYACWAIAIGWVWSTSVLFYWRYRSGQWRTMRVIEKQDAQPLHESTAAAGPTSLDAAAVTSE